MMRFCLALDNHCCLTLSVDVTCLSLGISVVPIPVKTIPKLFSCAFWVLPKTGVAELADQDNLGPLEITYDNFHSRFLQDGCSTFTQRTAKPYLQYKRGQK